LQGIFRKLRFLNKEQHFFAKQKLQLQGIFRKLRFLKRKNKNKNKKILCKAKALVARNF